MGQISITTEDGPQLINIAGDEPTQEELSSIEQQFFSQGEAREEVVDDTTLELGTKVFNDEPETVVQGTEASNVSGGPTNPGEIKSFGFRWRFGKADNRVGKTRVIEETFGEGSAMEFGPEDYGVNLDNVTEEIKEKYNLPASGTIRANKPGYSHWDLVNAGAEFRGPLIASMVAAPFTAGLSLPWAAAAMGTAALIGKGVDELQEDIQGVQDQTWLAEGEGLSQFNPLAAWGGKNTVVKDMLKEGIIMGSGEFILRPIFSLLGRIIKGPGPKYEPERVNQIMEQALKQTGKPLKRKVAEKLAQEEQRALVKKEIGEGARPTFGDATGKMLADRTLAIAEAVFPNNAALRQNTVYVKELVKKFKAGQISEVELKGGIDSRMGEVAAELKMLMKNPDTAAKQAFKELNKVIKEEIDLVTDVIKVNASKTFSTGEAEVLLAKLSNVEKLWRSRGSDLYKNASDRLGPTTYPLDSFNNLFNKLKGTFTESQNPVMQSQTIVTLRDFLTKNNKIDSLQAQLAGLRTTSSPWKLGDELPFTPRQAGQPAPAASKEELIAGIESQLKALGPRKELTYSELNELRTQLTSLKNTEAVREISGESGPILQGFTDEISSLLTKAELRTLKSLRAKGADPMAINSETAGYQMLRDANKYYKEGAEAFKKLEIQSIVATIKSGKTMDFSKLTEALVKPGQPLYLEQFLKALTPMGEAGTSAIRRLDVNALRTLKELSDVGDTTGFNAALKEFGISKKIIEPFDDVLSTTARDNTAFINITQNKSGQISEYIKLNTREPLIKDDLLSGLSNQWVKNTVQNTTRGGKFDPVAFFDKFDGLGPKLQNTLFTTKTADALRTVQKDVYVLGDEALGTAAGMKSIAATDFENITAGNIVSVVKRQIAESEKVSSNVLTKAMATGQIDSVPQLVTKLIKSPQDFKKFKKAYNELPASTIRDAEGKIIGRPTFDQVMNGYNGVKQEAMENIFNNAFPEGITTTTMQNAKFGADLLRAIKKDEEGLIQIFGEGNEALGKGFIKDLKLFGEQSMRATTKSYLGKAGLAAAAYAAAIGGLVGTAILSGGAGLIPIAATAAGMIFLPRILRSKGMLKLLTNPRTNARIYNTAKELGVDVGDNRWLLSQIAQDSVPLQIRQTINTIVRQSALQYQSDTVGDAPATARRLASQIDIPQENPVRVPSSAISETVTQQDSGTTLPMYRAATPEANLEFLRQIEREKLLGVRN